MSASFRYYLRTRYGECDAQKVVFNARYAEYVDLATIEFLRGIGFSEALVNGTLDYQVVRLAIEWKAPARFDQVLEISVFAKQLGHTSFTVAMEFRIAGSAAVIATAETVYVMVDPQTLQKTPLSAEFRAALERGAPGLVSDHAGYLSVSSRESLSEPGY